MLIDFLNPFNVGIRKKWLITRMKNFPLSTHSARDLYFIFD